MKLPQAGDQLPRLGNSLTRCLGRFTLLLMGWRVEGDIPDRKKMVLVLAPHTSNWDFVLTLACMLGTGIKISYFVKASLFVFPVKRLLTKLGAIAVDRSASAGLVEQMVAEFRRQDQLILGIAPEGTRGKVGQWKMGFLHIARQADVPLLLIRMDYQKKRVTIGPELNASENPQEDLLRIQALCRDVVARRPTNA